MDSRQSVPPSLAQQAMITNQANSQSAQETQLLREKIALEKELLKIQQQKLDMMIKMREFEMGDRAGQS